MQLTSGSPAAAYPSWSPDSRRIAFTLGGRIAVMDADGSGRTQLTHHGKQVLNDQPDW